MVVGFCFSSSKTIGMAELVDQALRSFRLLHDAFLVVLANGATQLIVVHGGAVLPLAPLLRHPHGVLDLEDTGRPVQPADAAAVQLRLAEQFLKKLPQVNVRSGAAAGGGGACGGAAAGGAAIC